MGTEAADPRTYSIIGACMEVHREVGHRLLENVYHHSLCVELRLRNIPFRREVALPVYYKGVELPCRYRADLICYEDVLVEIKALHQLSNVERAQVLNYLKLTGLRLALLVNFGARSLEYERLVL